MNISRRQMLWLLGILYSSTLLRKADFVSAAQAASSEGLVPLIFDKHYNITLLGLERLHPFDGCKFGKIHKALVKNELRTKADFSSPTALTDEMLLEVHTEKYLESLHHSRVLAKIFNVPALSKVPAGILNSRILAPMRLAGGGTLLTCRAALKHGLAINIGGGYHHADRNSGGGFCVYSDIPIALSILRKEGLVRRAPRC